MNITRLQSSVQGVGLCRVSPSVCPVAAWHIPRSATSHLRSGTGEYIVRADLARTITESVLADELHVDDTIRRVLREQSTGRHLVRTPYMREPTVSEHEYRLGEVAASAGVIVLLNEMNDDGEMTGMLARIRRAIVW